MPPAPRLCKIDRIPEEVAAQIPLIPDHELLRVIGRGAYGEIWLARTITGAFRAVKIVYRVTFDSERAFLREFQGMSAFEPISRAHAGFVNILHVGRTAEYLYYSMELADDHLAGRRIDIATYEPRTLKSDLARHKRLSAAESIALGLSLTQALEALHDRGLAHRDIKPSNIIFIDGVPKLADIGLVAASGQQSFVGTEGYVPPEGPGTPQADIYSLGKVLYELSTGKDRLDFPELDSQLSSQPDREHLLQLNEVLVKACANDPRKRYGSAADMHRDLATLHRGESIPPGGRVRRIAFTAIATLLIAAAAAAALWWRFHQPITVDLHLRTTIRTEPAGALVVLGDHAERSPATFEDLEPRRYRLRVMSPGFDPVETTVDLSGRNSLDLPVLRLNRSKGRLQIVSEPAGAHFTIRSEDGLVARTGVSPQNLADLPTGKYAVEAARGDWHMREEVEIQRDQTARTSFAFVDASTRITSDPSGADILIDNVARGRTPLQLSLPARAHEVRARFDDWPEQQQQLKVEPGTENSLHFVFANGSVKLTSAPGGATVLANGHELGQTPLVLEEVKPGDVSYELRMSGYNPATVTGRVEPGQQAFLAARLEKRVAPEPGQEWTNSLGMRFVSLGNIRISAWETRVQDYDAFCAATGRHHDPPDFKQDRTHPVVKVNWFDAVAFCKWLTEKESEQNLLEEHHSYRLPSDLEWSAAVGLPVENGATPEMRDGKLKNEFPWGKQWPPPAGSGNYADQSSRRRGGTVIEAYTDNFPQTSPVGTFKPNSLGIYDLGGNVWEWCAEGYKGNNSPSGRDWGVLRGGSWATSNRLEAQSSYRNVVDRNDRDVIYGFRCVLAPDGQSDAAH